jgi:hypothetical protein
MNYFNRIISLISLYLYHIHTFVTLSEFWSYEAGCNKHLNKKIHWDLCNPTPEFSNILTKIYGPKVFLLTKIKPEYSDILYNATYFPVFLVCRIRQVPL